MNRDEIHQQCERLRAAGARPAMLWTAPSVWYQLRAESPAESVRPGRGNAPDRAQYLCLHVNIDEYLPADVWRLADHHGTLLYDCREGKPVP